MLGQSKHKKLTFFAAMIMAVNISLAAFAGLGTIDDSNKKISLRNINKSSKNYALPSLKLSEFQFKNWENISQQRSNNTITIQSMIRLQKGNTTYVYPYKYKVQVSRFKTPAAPSFH